MKLKLDVSQMADEFFEDTRLLGVVAPIRDYQFCWRLNNRLRFDFRINNDVERQLTRNNRQDFFSVYSFPEPHCSLVHYLYNNQFDGEYLLPEFRHLDFLWLLKGDVVSDDYLQNIMQLLRSMGDVQMVMEIGQSQVKHKSHMIF